MGIGTAFGQTGLSATVVTSGTVSTSQTAAIKLSDLGVTQAPQNVRVVNNGTADVWIVITSAPATAAFPTPGTVTAGTPQAGLRLKPGIKEVLAVSSIAANVGNNTPPTPGFYVNTISTVASQQIDITPGEGGI